MTTHRLFFPIVAAVLTAGCGVALQVMPVGEQWENVSYDSLIRFGGGQSNNVVLVLMDNAAYAELAQSRDRIWDRALHEKLLGKLTEDKASAVVFDVFFGNTNNAEVDSKLAEAMRRQGRVVLMQKMADPQFPGVSIAAILPPAKVFVDAAARLGIGRAGETNVNTVVRRHWPFPSSAEPSSLPWAAAELSGARLSATPEERWLRYYGENGGWTTLSYHFALTTAPGYFRDKVVFIGNDLEQKDPGVPEADKFRTPYTRLNSQAVAGVKILATTYLNLVRGDWLRRLPMPAESGLLVLVGLVIGAGLGLLRWPAACVAAVVGFGATMMAAILMIHAGNTWFPWLIVAGGQLPVALVWTVVFQPLRRKASKQETIVLRFPEEEKAKAVIPGRPEAPDYELLDPPFGSGAYGKVWLVRNAIGQWQALKAIYLAGFNNNPDPYEREFNGIKRYKPVSEKHAGLLRIDFVSQKKPEGYFYYVMELGDALAPDWEKTPSSYRPRDLATVRSQAEGGRLPVRECVRIGIELCEALKFLHEQGLTHRDIKPQNIIFVRGQPKLADVGLISEIRDNPHEGTWVGTPGYMPPPPEPPGTPQADIYGLGMVLYVIRTGRNPDFFPGVSTTLAEKGMKDEFLPLNAVVLKACQPDCSQRYASVAEMQGDLRKIQSLLGQAAAAAKMDVVTPSASPGVPPQS